MEGDKKSDGVERVGKKSGADVWDTWGGRVLLVEGL